MGDIEKGKKTVKKGMGQQYDISQKKRRAANNSEPCAVIALGAVTAVVSVIGALAAAGANPFN